MSFIFLSSQTAQKNTKSYYGELKYHMEQLLDHKSDNQTEIIIRPEWCMEKIPI